jgi:hypothetical protein
MKLKRHQYLQGDWFVLFQKAGAPDTFGYLVCGLPRKSHLSVQYQKNIIGSLVFKTSRQAEECVRRYLGNHHVDIITVEEWRQKTEIVFKRQNPI